ncbi:MAG: hypothetical protein Q9184_004499 [Pyrenodesmia sp. 2 TL-2023]
MADILFDDDDDDDLWIEDPYAEADDLAEHTMHSPVLVNYDPAFESNDIMTDWDCYSDDYFDFESPKPKRRKLEERLHSKCKRKTPKSLKSLPELSLGDPASSDEETDARARSTVIWKTSGDSRTLPVVKDGEEEKVSILKDWRERFKPSPRNPDVTPERSEGSQRAVAVVIQQTSLADRTVNGAGAAPPSRSKKERRHGLHDDHDSDLSHRGGAASTHTNGPVQKRSMRAKPTPPEPRAPVPANGMTSTKRKRQSNEAEEPASAKKTRARRESQETSGQNGPNPEVYDTAAQESIDVQEERQSTGRFARKRKLSPPHDIPEPEPVAKRNRLQPSDGRVKSGSSRAKSTAAAAVRRRSTRRK